MVGIGTMDIRSIESFLTLSETLNFTKSAQKVCISQSAFSRQITALENEFGCPLFKRNKRKVELTEYGRGFLPFARRIISEYRHWERVREDIRAEGNRDELRIGFLCDLPAEVIPGAIKNFRTDHGLVDLIFSDLGKTGIIMGLLQDDFDCAFTLTNDAEKLDSFESIRLKDYPMCVVLPESHPLAARESLSMSEMASEDFVVVEDESYSSGNRFVQRLCSDAGFRPRISARASFVPSMLTLVKIGTGIAIISDAARTIAPNNLVFVPLSDEEAVTHLVLFWKRTNRDDLLREFIESIREQFR